MRRSGNVKVQDKQGPATGQAKQGTRSSDNVQDKRYRTSRVQLQDRQNTVQDQQTIRRIKGTGQAGSSYRTGKARYKISRHCTGQKGSRYRTSRVKLQDRQNKVQDQQTMPMTGNVKAQDKHRVQLQDRQNKVQDQQTIRRIKRTGQAGSSYRTGKMRYRISRQYAG
jgi:hypothetical protein